MLHEICLDKESEETSGNDALYVAVHEKLTELLCDNCEWSDLVKEAENARTNHNNNVEVNLICLSKMIKYCIRKGDYKAAEEKLNEYNDPLRKCTPSEMDVFKIIELYLRCFMERSKGRYDESYEIAMKSMEKIEKIQPGIVSTEFYVLAATVVNILAMKTEDSSQRSLYLSQAKDLFDKSLRHVEKVKCKSKFVKANLEQKIYTNLAMFHSGSSLAGFKLMDFRDSIVDETEAKENLNKIHRIVTNENIAFSAFRDIQHHLAQSDRFYLASKLEETRKKYLLNEALKSAKQAEHLASDGKFPELEHYAHYRATLIPHEIGNPYVVYSIVFFQLLTCMHLNGNDTFYIHR